MKQTIPDTRKGIRRRTHTRTMNSEPLRRPERPSISSFTINWMVGRCRHVLDFEFPAQGGGGEGGSLRERKTILPLSCSPFTYSCKFTWSWKKTGCKRYFLFGPGLVFHLPVLSQVFTWPVQFRLITPNNQRLFFLSDFWGFFLFLFSGRHSIAV